MLNDSLRVAVKAWGKLIPPGILCLSVFLAGCVASRPADIADICRIFEERRGWYKAAVNTEERWGIPVPVSMAFIYQESGFRARAKPGRKKILWVFPGPRLSTAYGYAQALDSTWQDYMDQSGNWDARRDSFADAIDFVGWYNAMSVRMNQIPSTDAANLYYAYHEGNAGFARQSHTGKPWLLDTGSKVRENARRFQVQYDRCQADLAKNWFQRLFS